MNWDNLRYFLAIAQAGSIRGAAIELNVNHTTVSRRINAFEESLGVKLFERQLTGYKLTPAGEQLTPTAERIQEEVDTLDRQTFGLKTQLEGELKITLPPAFALHLVAPMLSRFSKTYPGIELDIAISKHELNITRREADVAIRVTRTPPEHLIGRKITSYKKSVYASVEYLKEHSEDNLQWLGSVGEIMT